MRANARIKYWPRMISYPICADTLWTRETPDTRTRCVSNAPSSNHDRHVYRLVLTHFQGHVGRKLIIDLGLDTRSPQGPQVRRSAGPQVRATTFGQQVRVATRKCVQLFHKYAVRSMARLRLSSTVATETMARGNTCSGLVLVLKTPTRYRRNIGDDTLEGPSTREPALPNNGITS